MITDEQNLNLLVQLEQIQEANEQHSQLITFVSKQDDFKGLNKPNQVLQYDPSNVKLNLRSINTEQLLFLITVLQSEELQQKYL